MMIRKTYLSFFFFLLFSSLAFSQETKGDNLCNETRLQELWDTFYNQFYYKADFKAVTVTLKNVINCSHEAKNDELWARAHVYIAYSYFFIEEFEQQAKYLDLLEPHLHNLNIEERAYQGIKADFYYVQGVRYKNSGFNEIANYTLIKAVDILLELAGKTRTGEINYEYFGYDYTFNIITLINEIAIIYYKLGDYDSSVEYYNVALKLAELPEHQRSFRVNQMMALYMNLGDAYLQKGDLGLSKYYFDKALGFPLTDKSESEIERNRWAHLYKGLALFYNEINELDSALVYLEKGLAIEHGIASNIKLQRTKGKIHKNKSQFEISEKCLQKAIAKTEEHHGYFHIQMVMNYESLAEVKFAKKEYDEANRYYNKAINILLSKKSDKLEIDKIEIENLLHKRMSLDIINEKVKVLKELNLEKETIQCYQFIHENIFELQQKVILNDNSKFHLIGESKVIYEDAIEMALNLGDTKEAYRFSQLSKSMLLLQQIQEKAAIQVSALPDAIISDLHDLKTQIDQSQKKKSAAILLDDSGEIDKIETEIFDLNAQYRKLMTKIENDYPTYYNLKYNISSKSINDIQRQLKKIESTLIEYFIGEKYLYTFVLDGDSIHTSKKDIHKDLFVNINLMRESIQKYNGSYNSFELFKKSSYDLYQLLFEKIEEGNIIKNKNLIIIPDEQLNLIPFEALVNEKIVFDDTLTHYHQLKYLIQDYDISYTYSSNLIESNRKGKNKNSEFLGIAPTFNNSDLRKLEHNREEIININEIYNGENLLGANATYDNFIEKLKEKGVVHFATHAIFNDRIPLDSRIELADTSLYIYEIFSMEHNLQLAVMSACQTASGERRKGEGVVSLARAFFQSGCPSIIASLWDVSDQKAGGIMNEFHLNLKNGEPKNQALAKAKRTYLDNAISKNTHPFYWAGFVQMGDTTPLSNNSFNYWYFFIILAIILIFFGTLTKNVRNKNK